VAHGCNSVIATKLALTYADYAVTEAGFGADLGAEKFLDTKCRVAGLKPNAVVIVATIKALKLHGGQDKTLLQNEDISALKKGLPNLIKHIENIKNVYKLPVVVALNRFLTDTDKEINTVINTVKDFGVKAILADVWAKGGDGAIELAQEVEKLCNLDNSHFEFCYSLQDSVKEKIQKIATKIYGAKGVKYEDKALKDLQDIDTLKLNNYPVIIAKTQYSLSDNAKLLSRPEDFEITIRELQIRNGAKFIVAVAGSILLMPGLPKTPAGAKMTIDENNIITGLF